MAYSEKVVDHYENPRNVGSFDKGDETVGTGMVGAPACGDVMKLQIKVNPQTGALSGLHHPDAGDGLAGRLYAFNGGATDAATERGRTDPCPVRRNLGPAPAGQGG